ncbi:ABC transporter permease [Planotetraspora kaengkrachanensis]|uniref:ABC transporter permease n=1 Tax=Planotetraspora kaengkrachanensis TaxID=575193 RepID=UPI0019443895|nr:FtsX-like permease family protein [Planotetraspora kaengkrachanensis]
MSTLRFRLSAFTATFVAMLVGAAIVAACGGLMETGIRLDVPPHRLAASPVVVTGDQTYDLPKADPADDEEDVESAILPERVRLGADTLSRIAAVPGVRGAAADGESGAVAVRTAPEADPAAVAARIEQTVPGTVALTGDERGLAEHPEALPSRENLIVLAAVFGAMAVMVALFVVATTLGLSVQQRRRETALLRAVGATPAQVRRMVLGETLMVSATATALGCLAAPFLGRWLFGRLADGGVVPAVVEFHQGLLPAAVAVLVSALTALIAVRSTVRSATIARPSEALAGAALPVSRIGAVRRTLAAVCFAGGIALALVSVLIMPPSLVSSTAGPAVLVWAVGLALVGPALVAWITRRLPWPFRGPSGYLAIVNSRARAVTLAAAVTPVMLATGMATANLYMQTTQVDAAAASFTQSLRADAVLSPVTPGLLERVRAVPGVSGASEHVTSTGFVERPHDGWQREEGWPLRGVTADGVGQTMAFDVAAGSLADLNGNTVALTTEHARNIGDGVGLGDTITLRLGDRSAVDLRVVALLKVETGAELFVLPAGLLAPHTTAGVPDEILVRAAQGTDLSGLGVQVRDRAALAATHDDQQSTQAWVNYLLIAMILAYTTISLVNTQVMATAQRRGEFALQRLTGSTRAQVMRMTGLEALLVAGVGVVLGTVASVISLVPFALAVAGTPAPSGPIGIYVSIVAAAVVLVLAATWAPAWTVTRVRAAEAVAAA